MVYTQSSKSDVFNLLTYSFKEELFTGLCKTPSTSQLLKAGPLGFFHATIILAAQMCGFYDLLNNFWGGTFWIILCMFMFLCIGWKGRI